MVERDIVSVVHKAVDTADTPSLRLTHNQVVTVAAAASGFLAGVVVCPLDVVKTRLQAQGVNKRYGNFVSAFQTIAREEGVAGLYRGLVAVTLGYLPTWTIYFSVYENAKHFYPPLIHDYLGTDREVVNHLFLLLTAGTASTLAVNPVWVVKTRLMIQSSEPPQYSGTLDAFRKMYRAEGVRVFYSGLVPLLFGLVHVGIHFPVYEALKKALKVNEDHTLFRLIVASLGSKMVASTITYPHEILRTRMQMRLLEPKTIVALIKHIAATEGIRGFYAGYLTNLARTLPASAVTLVSFEYFKHLAETGHWRIRTGPTAN